MLRTMFKGFAVFGACLGLFGFVLKYIYINANWSVFFYTGIVILLAAYICERIVAENVNR